MALVLVVDDEFGIAEVVQDVLVDAGHRVVLAAHGRAALERIAEERPDVVLTDFMMPVMDGPALLGALAADPATASIPVGVMSSLPLPAVAESARHARIVLRKPFTVAELLDGLARLLDEAASGDRSGR